MEAFSFVILPSGTVFCSSLVILHVAHNSHTFHRILHTNTRMETTPTKVIIPMDRGAPTHRRKRARLQYDESDESEEDEESWYHNL